MREKLTALLQYSKRRSTLYQYINYCSFGKEKEVGVDRDIGNVSLNNPPSPA